MSREARAMMVVESMTQEEREAFRDRFVDIYCFKCVHKLPEKEGEVHECEFEDEGEDADVGRHIVGELLTALEASKDKTIDVVFVANADLVTDLRTWLEVEQDEEEEVES